jgi:hypothetical protein
MKAGKPDGQEQTALQAGLPFPLKSFAQQQESTASQYHDATSTTRTMGDSAALTMNYQVSGMVVRDNGNFSHSHSAYPAASATFQGNQWPTMCGSFRPSATELGRPLQYTVNRIPSGERPIAMQDSPHIKPWQEMNIEPAVHGNSISLPAHLQRMHIRQEPFLHSSEGSHPAMWGNACWQSPSNTGDLASPHIRSESPR